MRSHVAWRFGQQPEAFDAINFKVYPYRRDALHYPYVKLDFRRPD